jgi:hypothetical protein
MHKNMNAEETSPLELIGIYDSDSTLLGEISYWIGARLGKKHCSLCDITHGVFTVKSEWKACAASIPVPFLTYHRNDAPHDALTAASETFPIVLARYVHGIEVVYSGEQLEKFNGDPQQFSQALTNIFWAG